MEHFDIALYVLSLLSSILTLGTTISHRGDLRIKRVIQYYVICFSIFILHDIFPVYMENSGYSDLPDWFPLLSLNFFALFLILTAWCCLFLIHEMINHPITRRKWIHIPAVILMIVTLALLPVSGIQGGVIYSLIGIFTVIMLYLIIRIVTESGFRGLFPGAVLLLLLWAVLEDFVLALLPEIEIYPIVNFIINVIIIFYLNSRKSPSTGNRNSIPLDQWFAQYALTDREQEITQLLAKGYDKPKIASSLFISSHTVKTHMIHIYEKLGINSKYQLISKIFKETDITQ